MIQKKMRMRTTMIMTILRMRTIDLEIFSY
jgi:hypothetical protein